MGRQINFFMVNEDEKELFDLIQASGDVIINKFGVPVTYDTILHESLEQVWIKSSQSVTKIRESGMLDRDSDIIELDRNTIRKNRIEQGRLYLDMYYLDESGNIARKGKWLETLYDRYKKWVVNHCSISDDKHWYISRATYQLYLQGFQMVASFAAAPHSFIKFSG